MDRSLRHLGPACALACGAVLSACAPALDWRDLRPEGSALQLQFPCKPSTQRRDVPLADVRANLALHACSAGGQTWGLAVADLGDPARVGPALTELTRAAAANLGASAPADGALQVPGATPNAHSRRVRLQGRSPDGSVVQMELAVFARGTQVYQASVLGQSLAPEASDTFFASMRVLP